MFNVEPHRYLASIWGAWFLFTMLAVFSAGVVPSVLTIPAAAFVIWVTFWCVDCAYRTERFSKYASLRLFTNLGVAPGFAFLMALVATYKQFKLGLGMSILISCMPLAVCMIVYFLLCVWRNPRSSLVVRSQRVEVVEPNQENRWALGAVGGGLGILIYPVFHAYRSPALLLVFLFIVIALFMFFYHRTSISSLRTLKDQEAREHQEYTFMNVEELRSRRATSWIGRIFATKVDR
ncbi:hypothetical protein AWM79_13615 [Pseudomonas agarici]|uniref:Uncharacterized protein n=1 Tax=Pseudomonas agarici TaxID=46677 RepID=A0A0X1T2K7_PSEAA|nr:hypothetical protein [Pseudomonas agarici]AMB86284.1 hypothetical protein AWM79_13615 [Pseudomonas agarici]NWB90322.1 hypothetical protein [Pseudomonas agarici]